MIGRLIVFSAGVTFSYLLSLFPWIGLACAVADSTIIGINGGKKHGISFSYIALSISTVLLLLIKYEKAVIRNLWVDKLQSFGFVGDVTKNGVD